MIKDDKQIYLDVTRLMHELGCPAHLKGHDYLRRAIVKVYLDNSYLNNLVDRLYTDLAEEFHTSRYAVERGIRSVIETAWLRGNYDAINVIFGNTVDNMRAKPCNKEFIAMLVDVLKVNSI